MHYKKGACAAIIHIQEKRGLVQEKKQIEGSCVPFPAYTAVRWYMEMVIHVVKQGESLYSIARDYGVNPRQLAVENDLSTKEPLVIGQTVVVQFPKTVHIVRAGQTLSTIARQYGTTVTALYRNNRWLSGQSTIREGDVLVIAYFNQPKGALVTAGYAYPSIHGELLRSALPYLSHVLPFTYGIASDGSLLELTDARILAVTREYRTQPLLHLSTVTEQGNFSNGRASMVLNDVTMQRNLAQDVLKMIQEKGYAGVDVDFEFIFPEERERYAQFIELLRQTLNPYGYSVTVALAPKTSAAQKGLLYEGHDYALLGDKANDIFLMTYEWGYTYGPPMAVAPLPNVRQVVDYALTEIPAEKISMGIPNYGYDWTLPYVQGISKAQSISNVRAVELARSYGAEIQFDTYAQAPWFRYYDENGIEHEVWFEDARSIRAKLLLAQEKGLRGVGYWNLDRPFPQNWLVLNAMSRIL